MRVSTRTPGALTTPPSDSSASGEKFVYSGTSQDRADVELTLSLQRPQATSTTELVMLVSRDDDYVSFQSVFTVYWQT